MPLMIYECLCHSFRCLKGVEGSSITFLMERILVLVNLNLARQFRKEVFATILDGKPSWKCAGLMGSFVFDLG